MKDGFWEDWQVAGLLPRTKPNGNPAEQPCQPQYDRYKTGAWFSITDDNISICQGAKLANMNVGTWEIWKKVDDKASYCLPVINRSMPALEKPGPSLLFYSD